MCYRQRCVTAAGATCATNDPAFTGLWSGGIGPAAAIMLLSTGELELIGKIVALNKLISLGIWCQSALSCTGLQLWPLVL